jgi:hypothetical protein
MPPDANRYPGDYPALTRQEATRAIDLAEKARAEVLAALPAGWPLCSRQVEQPVR